MTALEQIESYIAQNGKTGQNCTVAKTIGRLTPAQFVTEAMLSWLRPQRQIAPRILPGDDNAAVRVIMDQGLASFRQSLPTGWTSCR